MTIDDHPVGGEIYGQAIFGPTQPDVVHRDFASVVEAGNLEPGGLPLMWVANSWMV